MYLQPQTAANTVLFIRRTSQTDMLFIPAPLSQPLCLPTAAGPFHLDHGHPCFAPACAHQPHLGSCYPTHWGSLTPWSPCLLFETRWTKRGSQEKCFFRIQLIYYRLIIFLKIKPIFKFKFNIFSLMSSPSLEQWACCIHNCKEAPVEWANSKEEQGSPSGERRGWWAETTGVLCSHCSHINTAGLTSVNLFLLHQKNLSTVCEKAIPKFILKMPTETRQ